MSTTDPATSAGEAVSTNGAARPGGPGTVRGMLSLEDLRKEVEAGGIDTIVTAFTDMQGRLIGKRIQGEYFLEDVVDNAIEGCNYLLALDMEMEPVPGYEMANWEKGYGDFEIVPDVSTLRRIPWLDGTALVLCDVVKEGGSPVAASPRQVLIAQYERARELGFVPMMASELEFYLYRESFAEAHEKGYRDLTPTIPYILDYHVLATTMDEPFMGQVRRGMQGAGIPVEFSKGEAWYGQHELNTRYADGVTSADRHTIYKNGVKEIAFFNGISATFMAKPSEKDIGSSCHIHASLVDPDSGAACSWTATRRPTVPPLPRRDARPHPRPRAVHRAGRQLLQALRHRELGPDLGVLGPRQPHLRLPDRRPRTVPPGRVPDPGRRRQSLSRLSRRCWPPGSTGSRTRPTRGPS